MVKKPMTGQKPLIDEEYTILCFIAFLLTSLLEICLGDHISSLLTPLTPPVFICKTIYIYKKKKIFSLPVKAGNIRSALNYS
jgi:hypothetical protein